MKFIFRVAVVLVIIVIVIAAVFFFLFIWYIPHASMKPYEDLSCSGRIVSIKDSGHFCYIGVQQNNSITLLETDRMCNPDRTFYLSIALGDSLIKEKGKFSVTIIHKGYTTRHVYDYPMCYY